MNDKKYSLNSVCVCCGSYVPEGTMVCLQCIKNGGPILIQKEDINRKKLKRSKRANGIAATIFQISKK